MRKAEIWEEENWSIRLRYLITNISTDIEVIRIEDNDRKSVGHKGVHGSSHRAILPLELFHNI